MEKTILILTASREFLLSKIDNFSSRSPLRRLNKLFFEINPHKCPGPDGMNRFFYQQFWKIIGGDIFQMVQSFFKTGKLEDGINATNISLITKKLGANIVADFRPIILSNVIYKIVAKILS